MITGMTKDDQIQAVASATGLTTKQARDAIDAVVAVVRVGLREEEQITLHGLGMFSVQRRGARRVRNPATGVMMDLPAKAVVKFKPSAPLRRDVEARYS
jgi:DNA-binding protein HU-beta